MIEFRRNKNTGIIEAWKDGKKIGEIIMMGDEIKKLKKIKKQRGGIGINGKL